MNSIMIRNLSLCARRLLVKSQCLTQSAAPVAAFATASNRCKFRHYSTKFESSVDLTSAAEFASSSSDEDVTEEERKKIIQKLLIGDSEFPVDSMSASEPDSDDDEDGDLTVEEIQKLFHGNSESSVDLKSATECEDVTEEELKNRIQKLYDGDMEAIPSILEAILTRKLAGKNDEDLIKQLPCERADSESDDNEGI